MFLINPLGRFAALESVEVNNKENWLLKHDYSANANRTAAPRITRRTTAPLKNSGAGAPALDRMMIEVAQWFLVRRNVIRHNANRNITMERDYYE
jgi:hypothetical protein